MEDPQLAELARTYGARYDIQATPDGRVILSPKLTAEASRLRLGGRDLSDAEFEAEFGDLSVGPA